MYLLVKSIVTMKENNDIYIFFFMYINIYLDILNEKKLTVICECNIF